MSQSNASASQPELEWIQLKKDFDADRVESPQDKFIRKFKQNPLVPLGTCTMIKNKKKMTNDHF